MIKTKLDLKRLAEKSVFLKERIDHDSSKFVFISNDETGQLEKYYALWQKKAGGNGGEQAFFKRLALDNLSKEQAKQVLSPIKWNEVASLPQWVFEIDQILSVLPISVKQLQEKVTYQLTDDQLFNNIQNYHALLPFIYFAEQQLLLKLGNDRKLLSHTAWNDIVSTLLKQLDVLIFPSILKTFELDKMEKNPLFPMIGHVVSKEKRMKDWLKFQESLLEGKWFELITTYPVLARLMMIHINNWLNNIFEFVSHVKADEQQLTTIFNQGKPLGKMSAIQADVSDLHNKGKGVFIVSFFGGLKIVYKPRSLQIDVAWAKWVEYLAQKGLPHPLKTPKVLDKKEYGWIEFIDNTPVYSQEDARAFFFRSGVLLGTIYAFGGNDFHYENIIANGAHPILVDTETLLLNKVKPFKWEEIKATALYEVEHMLSESVARVAMLPWWRKNNRGKAIEFGAVSYQNKQNFNLPTYQGELLNVHDYENDLLAGLEWVFSFLSRHKQQLLGENSLITQIFGDCLFRYVVRNTQLYMNMLHHTMKSNFLKDAVLYSIEIERIAPAYLLHSPDESLEDLWNLFKSERDALEVRDIPIFYGEANELTIRDKTKPLYTTYFMESAIDNCKNIIAKLNEKEQAFQIDLTKTLLSLNRKEVHACTGFNAMNPPPAQQLEITDDVFLSEAIAIYNEMMDKRVVGEQGDFNWFTLRHELETEKIIIGPAGFHLYDGTVGIGTFIAALYHFTKQETMKKKALMTVDYFRKLLYDSYNPFPVHRLPLGLGEGVASLIRGYMLMGRYLNDESLLKDVRTIASKIKLEQINRDQSLNLLSGTAGLIMVLVDLYKETKDEKIIELATYCGKQLLAKRVKVKTGHRIWLDKKYNRPLTGMGNGLAGIAASLAKLAHVTSNAEFIEAAFEAITYENMFYESSAYNWLDLRNITCEGAQRKLAFMHGWCSGAPGIGLSRLTLLEMDERDESQNDIVQDIENAIVFSCSFNENVSDHLCCGQGGSIDLLIEASQMLHRADLLEVARQKMGLIISRKRSNGYYTLHSDPESAINNHGIFQGIAGIGYEMLRLIDPKEIVSVIY